jgi:hypothetical protein
LTQNIYREDLANFSCVFYRSYGAQDGCMLQFGVSPLGSTQICDLSVGTAASCIVTALTDVSAIPAAVRTVEPLHVTAIAQSILRHAAGRTVRDSNPSGGKVFSVLYTCLRPAMGPTQRDICFATYNYFCKPARTSGSHFSMLPSTVSFRFNSVGHETAESEYSCRSAAGLCL